MVVGSFEFIQVSPFELVVAGWAINLGTGISAFELLVDDSPILAIQASSRPDVAEVMSHRYDSENSGFLWKIWWPSPLQTQSGTKIEVLVRDLEHEVVGSLDIRCKTEARSRPFPPAELMWRAGRTANPNVWNFSGLKCAFDFHKRVQPHLDQPIGRTLEWGCGAGRITQHLHEQGDWGELSACDIDKEAVEWLSSNLGIAECATSSPGQPLPYANDHFDVVLAYSVMTHLNPSEQQFYLREIHRILRPNGVAALTTHGFTVLTLRHPEKIKELQRRGFLDTGQDENLDGIAPEGYYRESFNSPEAIAESWSHSLKLIAVEEAAVSNLQDLVLLRKLD